MLMEVNKAISSKRIICSECLIKSITEFKASSIDMPTIRFKRIRYCRIGLSLNICTISNDETKFPSNGYLVCLISYCLE